MKKLICNVKQVQPILLYDGSFKDVMNEVDNTFQIEMKRCYTSFNSITEPILSRRQIMTLVAIYKSRLPHHYKVMKEVLGFHLKEKKLEMSICMNPVIMIDSYFINFYNNPE